MGTKFVLKKPLPVCVIGPHAPPPDGVPLRPRQRTPSVLLRSRTCAVNEAQASCTNPVGVTVSRTIGQTMLLVTLLLLKILPAGAKYTPVSKLPTSRHIVAGYTASSFARAGAGTTAPEMNNTDNGSSHGINLIFVITCMSYAFAVIDVDTCLPRDQSVPLGILSVFCDHPVVAEQCCPPRHTTVSPSACLSFPPLPRDRGGAAARARGLSSGCEPEWSCCRLPCRESRNPQTRRRRRNGVRTRVNGVTSTEKFHK